MCPDYADTKMCMQYCCTVTVREEVADLKSHNLGHLTGGAGTCKFIMAAQHIMAAHYGSTLWQHIMAAHLHQYSTTFAIVCVRENTPGD